MTLQINPQWDGTDVLLTLTAVAQRIGTDAQLFLYDTAMEYRQQVTIGLSEKMYSSVYHVNENTDVYIQYPNGAAIIYLESVPGQLTLRGGDAFCAAAAKIISGFDPGLTAREPVAFFHCPALGKMSVNALLRLLFKEAGRLRASMWLSDADHNAKMLRITATWMLDVYEKPIDMELRLPDGGCIVFHMPNCGVYANQKGFSEAGKLLENIEHR